MQQRYRTYIIWLIHKDRKSSPAVSVLSMLSHSEPRNGLLRECQFSQWIALILRYWFVRTLDDTRRRGPPNKSKCLWFYSKSFYFCSFPINLIRYVCVQVWVDVWLELSSISLSNGYDLLSLYHTVKDQNSFFPNNLTSVRMVHFFNQWFTVLTPGFPLSTSTITPRKTQLKFSSEVLTLKSGNTCMRQWAGLLLAQTFECRLFGAVS